MTIDKWTRSQIRGHRFLLSGKKVAELYGISETTVYKIWHEAGSLRMNVPNMETPYFNEVLRAMWRFDYLRGEFTIEQLLRFRRRDEEILSLLEYYRLYGSRVLYTLEENWGPAHLDQPDTFGRDDW